MTLPRRLDMSGAVVIALLAASLAGMSARQATSGAVSIDDDELGVVVSGPRGPEAGVWVIAATRDLPTSFRPIVVTDAPPTPPVRRFTGRTAKGRRARWSSSSSGRIRSRSEADGRSIGAVSILQDEA